MKYRIGVHRITEVSAHRDNNVAYSHDDAARLVKEGMAALERMVSESAIKKLAIIVTWEDDTDSL